MNHVREDARKILGYPVPKGKWHDVIRRLSTEGIIDQNKSMGLIIMLAEHIEDIEDRIKAKK